MGKTSLILALAIFLFVAVSAVLFFSLGSNLPGTVLLVTLIVWLLAPLGHLTGLILGIISQFRSARRDWAGIAGIVLNAVLGLLGAGLLALFGWALSHTIGAFT